MRRFCLEGSFCCVVLAFVSCTDTAPPASATGVVAEPVASELGGVARTPELKSCGHAEGAAMRFSAPGYIVGTSVGLFVRYEGVAAGARSLRIWWDWDNHPELFRDVGVSNDDPFEHVFSHVYANALAGETRTVRTELVVDGRREECIRVRRVVFGEPATGGGGGSNCGATCSAFLTSVGYPITMYGSDLSGADALCQSHAVSGGLTGTYKAWLSNATQSPSSRFSHANVPYEAFLGGALIANDFADLTDGMIVSPMRFPEVGTQITALVYTGTNVDGTSSANHCTNWTNTGGTADVGFTSHNDAGWTMFSIQPCNSFHRLMCFEQ